jgi:hypothetical protein
MMEILNTLKMDRVFKAGYLANRQMALPITPRLTTRICRGSALPGKRGVYTSFTGLPKGSKFCRNRSASIQCRVRPVDIVLVNAVQHQCGTLNSAMDAPVIGRSRQLPEAHPRASGCLDWRKMSIGRILVLLALVAPAAYAQLPATADPRVAVLGVPFSMRLELGSPLIGSRSSVFTSDYWSRAYADRAELENRFGIHLADVGLRPYLVQQTPVPGHPHFNFVQELRWPGGSPLTGLQFERRDLLFRGDRLSIRATSDLQTLLRGIGLAGSETEVDMLSLLGWRSHSRLVWELGEPTRELRWQFSAGFDRRAYVQSSSVDLQVLRRF